MGELCRFYALESGFAASPVMSMAKSLGYTCSKTNLCDMKLALAHHRLLFRGNAIGCLYVFVLSF